MLPGNGDKRSPRSEDAAEAQTLRLREDLLKDALRKKQNNISTKEEKMEKMLFLTFLCTLVRKFLGTNC